MLVWLYRGSMIFSFWYFTSSIYYLNIENSLHFQTFFEPFIGIPLGRTCGLCGYMVDHPGSAYGSIIVAGDPYKDYHFYDYKSE